MLEPEEIKRWQRMARALGRKADDAEGLAQVLELAELHEHYAMEAVGRLLAEGCSYGYLARGLGLKRQALHQRHARWLARSGGTHRLQLVVSPPPTPVEDVEEEPQAVTA